ncbi:alanine racemase [Gordonia soli]|uniref:D-serine dehydratase-like domain-containing protein n=1 Tax=Gordonia soli NBRC 108243 TaxID=1223545 RepID=M0QNN9_9ACTN|nr:alanine racemase [Gordonia soli]GAC69866.1 hypothetical protein GS4_28_01140 [Gordonia soli NBRC 108243]
MIDTPYLVVDSGRLDANLRKVATRARASGVALRPHAKTHKCAEIAHRQLESGAIGLTVATIGEAEAFASVGCTDLFIAYPLWVTRHRAERLRALAGSAALRLTIDSVEGAARMAAEMIDTEVEVVVEVDCGQHRTGVAPDEAGKVAAAAVEHGLNVVGVFTFPGHGYGLSGARHVAATEESSALERAADSLRCNEIDPVVRSGGSTPTLEFADTSVLTEVRPGVYPFNDAQQVELGTATFGEVALFAASTVIHRTGDRIVVDAGSKILGADRPGWASGFGRLLDFPDARITSLSEHHAVVDVSDTDVAVGAPDLGETVRVIPNHVCTAVNLVDEIVVDCPERGVSWPTLARGRNS